MKLKDKVLNGEELTEKEVEFLFERSWGSDIDFRELDDFEVEDEWSDEKRRWSALTNRVLSTIDKDGRKRFFIISFDEGLTENQENWFEAQVAEEVKRKEITTYQWLPFKSKGE